ncbi:hypothetical protein JTB14_016070 [Gonioctena quinquepunctata]|nr:hypothetical protein JTB14_016070 [Gonioctena quinquepunctata]
MNSNVGNLLQTDNEKVIDTFQKSQNDVLEYVESIKNWFKIQSHLPELPSDALILSFLVTNKFIIEKTKTKLDMYYTIRSLLPECFRNKSPSLPHMQKTSNIVYYCPLPKLTRDLLRVNVMKLMGDTDHFDSYNLFAYIMNINEIKLQEDLSLGEILIADLEHLQIAHLRKFTPIHMKKAETILKKVFSNRIKGIHILNYPSFADTLLGIVKSVLNNKMISRIHLHSSVDSLLKDIPADILPSDYGGDERSLSKLHEQWKLKLDEHKDRFDTLEAIHVKEDLRPSELKNDNILGYYGHFKKLDID